MDGVAVRTDPEIVPWTRRQRMTFAGVLVVGLALVFLGFSTAKTGDEGNKPSDPAIERLIPEPGASLQVNQDTVGIDLVTGYRAELSIDGQPIPTSEIIASQSPAFDEQIDAQYDAGQGTTVFTPREGATIEAFSPGRHLITATYWKVTEGRERARTFTWGFDVKT
jgi:hypothetical protein